MIHLTRGGFPFPFPFFSSSFLPSFFLFRFSSFFPKSSTTWTSPSSWFRELAGIFLLWSLKKKSNRNKKKMISLFSFLFIFLDSNRLHKSWNFRHQAGFLLAARWFILFNFFNFDAILFRIKILKNFFYLILPPCFPFYINSKKRTNTPFKI